MRQDSIILSQTEATFDSTVKVTKTVTDYSRTSSDDDLDVSDYISDSDGGCSEIYSWHPKLRKHLNQKAPKLASHIPRNLIATTMFSYLSSKKRKDTFKHHHHGPSFVSTFRTPLWKCFVSTHNSPVALQPSATKANHTYKPSGRDCSQSLKLKQDVSFRHTFKSENAKYHHILNHAKKILTKPPEH